MISKRYAIVIEGKHKKVEGGIELFLCVLHSVTDTVMLLHALHRLLQFLMAHSILVLVNTTVNLANTPRQH